MFVSITSFIWNASSGSFCMTLPNSSYVTDHSLLLIMSSDYKTCHFCDAPRHNAALISPNHLFFVTEHSHWRALSSPLTFRQHSLILKWHLSSTWQHSTLRVPRKHKLSYFPCLWAEDFHAEFSSANHFFLFGRSTCCILVEGVFFEGKLQVNQENGSCSVKP